MRLFTITVLASIFSLCAYSQGTLQRGYVITLSNDTITGSIDLKGAAKDIFQSCVIFPDAPPYEMAQYSAKEIRGYGFDTGRKLVSNQFGLDIEADEPLFIEQLVTGLANLYSVSNQFYFNVDDDKVIFLGSGGDKGSVKDRLLDAFSKCESRKSVIKGLKMDRKSLMSAFVDYGECVGGSLENAPVDEFESPEQSANWYFGSNISSGYYKLVLSSSMLKYKYLSGEEFISSRTYNPNLHVRVWGPDRWRNVGVQMDFGYSSRSFSHTDEIITFYTRRFYMDISYGVLELRTMIKYRLPLGKVIPYVGVGLVHNILTNPVINHWSESETNGETYTLDQGAFEINNMEFGSIAELGINLRMGKNLVGSIATNSLSINGLSNENRLDAIVSSIGYRFGMSYRFK